MEGKEKRGTCSMQHAACLSELGGP